MEICQLIDLVKLVTDDENCLRLCYLGGPDKLIDRLEGSMVQAGERFIKEEDCLLHHEHYQELQLFPLSPTQGVDNPVTKII